MGPHRLAFNGSIEAPYLYERDGFFYQFVNWGTCCQGSSSTYNIRVGRSTNVIGPYFDRSGVNMVNNGGTLFLGTEENFIGPGHISIFTTHGSDWFGYHYYDGNDNGVSKFNLRAMRWTADGWPVAGPPFPIPEPSSLAAAVFAVCLLTAPGGELAETGLASAREALGYDNSFLGRDHLTRQKSVGDDQLDRRQAAAQREQSMTSGRMPLIWSAPARVVAEQRPIATRSLIPGGCLFVVAVTVAWLEIAWGTPIAAGQNLTGNLDAHDPSSVIHADGKYYFFSTGTGVSSKTSTNRVHWTNGPAVFATAPSWIATAVPANTNRNYSGA